MPARFRLLPLSLALVALAAGPASAQLPPGPPQTVEPPLADPQPAADENVKPAQYVTPAPAAPRRTVPVPVPTAVTVVDPPVPQVTISVRVASLVAHGKDVDYVITVANPSRAVANNVIARDLVPDTAEFVRATPQPTGILPPPPGKPAEVRWEWKTLKPGERHEIRLTLRPRSDAGEVRNVALVQFESGQSVVTRVSKPRLAVRLKGPSQLVRGEATAFELEVANTGEVDATNVTLRDLLPDGCEFEGKPAGQLTGGAARLNESSWPVGTLRPGQAHRVAVKVVPKVTRPTSVMRAVAEADGGVRTDADWSFGVGDAKLRLLMTGPPERPVGGLAKYEIVVHNTGDVPLNNVVVTDRVPARATVVAASNGNQLVRDWVQWMLKTLEPGEIRTFSVTVRVNEPGPKTNVVTASADRAPAQEMSVPTEFKPSPALNVDATQESPRVALNGQNRLAVTVRNTGTGPVNDVRVEVSLPAQFGFLASRGAEPTGRWEAGVVRFDPATVAPGEAKTFAVDVQARSPGDARTKFTIRSGALSQPLVEELQTAVEGDAAPTRAAGPG